MTLSEICIGAEKGKFKAGESKYIFDAEMSEEFLEKHAKFVEYQVSLQKVAQLSRRDQFAMAAMQGLIYADASQDDAKEIAQAAVICADALIAELDKERVK